MHKKILYILFIFTCCIAIAGSDESLKDPYKIINNYYKAIGGFDKYRAEKTSFMTATIEIIGSGLKGEIRQWTKTPLNKRVEIDLSAFKITEGDNGEYGWEVDYNGKITKKTDELTITRRKIDLMIAEFEHLNPSSEFIKIEYKGINKVEEKDCYAVKITNSINEDYQINFYDMQSFFLLKEEAKRGDKLAHTYYSDYREADGIKRPFRVEIIEFLTKMKTLIMINEFKANLDIDPALFEPPSEDVKDYEFLNGKNNVENIPFKYIEGHIYIPVKINGVESLWFLDTGTSIACIDSDFARELSIESKGTLKAKGAANSVDLDIVEMPDFTVPGIKMKSQTAVAIPLRSTIDKMMGINVRGILGFDFLSRFVTKVDFDHETLSFYSPEEFKYPGNGTVIKMKIVDNKPEIKMMLDDRYEGNWRIDTGADATNIHYPFAKEHGLFKREGRDLVGIGAEGEFNERISRFSSVVIAGYRIENPLMRITTSEGTGSFSDKTAIGNIGNDILSRFIVYFDYKHEFLILEKGKNFDKEPPMNKSGLKLVYNDKKEVVIESILKSTPSEKSGFKKGDIVLKINGKPVSDFDGIIAIRNLLRGKEATELKFEIMRDKEVKRITLILAKLL